MECSRFRRVFHLKYHSFVSDVSLTLRFTRASDSVVCRFINFVHIPIVHSVNTSLHGLASMTALIPTSVSCFHPTCGVWSVGMTSSVFYLMHLMFQATNVSIGNLTTSVFVMAFVWVTDVLFEWVSKHIWCQSRHDREKRPI